MPYYHDSVRKNIAVFCCQSPVLLFESDMREAVQHEPEDCEVVARIGPIYESESDPLLASSFDPTRSNRPL